MLNLISFPSIKYNCELNLRQPSFSGNYFCRAWKNEQVRNTILKNLAEYFKGEERELSSFIALIERHHSNIDNFSEEVTNYFRNKPNIQRRVQENARKIAQDRINFLQREFFMQCKIPATPSSSLIDIGVGDGKATMSLAKSLGISHQNIQGIDICKMPTELPFRTLTYDGSDLNRVVKDKFDIAAAISTLHHSDNPRRLLEQINRVIKDNGYLLVVEHPSETENDRLFHYIMDKFEYRIVEGKDDFPIPNHLYHPIRWERLMNESGFKILRTITPQGANPFNRVGYVLQKIPASESIEVHRAMSLVPVLQQN